MLPALKPAPDIMADDPHNTSDMSDHVEPAAAKEDAETTAARRELKHTTISEKAGQGSVQLSQDDKSDDDAPKGKATGWGATPGLSLNPAKDETLKEQISSPKKKRAHDELDENKDVAEAPLEAGTSGKSASTTAVESRTQRSEPEKKRPRDRQASASAIRSGQEEVVRPCSPDRVYPILTLLPRSLCPPACRRDQAWNSRRNQEIRSD